MVEGDHSRTQVKLKSEKHGTLCICANSNGYNIKLESTNKNALPLFFISKKSKEYKAFFEFFERCKMMYNSHIVYDEKIPIEHATILLCYKNEKGILLRFASENAENAIRHYNNVNNAFLSRAYYTLFRDLQNIKYKSLNAEFNM